MKKVIQWLVAITSLAILVAGLASGQPPTGTLLGRIEVTKGNKQENTVVYLRGVKGSFPVPQEPAVMDQKGNVFTPHLLAVQRGQRVLFKNGDPHTHNVHLFWGNRSMFNQSQPPGSEIDWTPPRTGEYPILCNIHPEMSAFLLVFDHPFFSAVPASQFQMENIPEGNYTLVAVRDVRGELKERETEVTLKSGQTTEVSVTF